MRPAALLAALALASCGMLTPIRRPSPRISIDGGKTWARADSPEGEAMLDAASVPK